MISLVVLLELAMTTLHMSLSPNRKKAHLTL